MGTWGFLTNHALVLLHVAEHPNSTLREIASSVGITERATLSILRTLEGDDIISRRREGRRNRYRVNFRAVMERRTQALYTVEELIKELAAFTRRLERARA